VRARLSTRAPCDVVRRVAQAASTAGAGSGRLGEVRSPNDRGAGYWPGEVMQCLPFWCGWRRGTDWGGFMEISKVKTVGR
jgi:hypothetical protein